MSPTSHFRHVAGCIALVYSLSCDRNMQAISIPIRNIFLQAPDTRRHVAVSIGTPPQAFASEIDSFSSLFVSAFSALCTNHVKRAVNTVVYDQSSSCDTSTPLIQCIAEYEGAFDESVSSSPS